MEMQGLER